MPTSVDLVLERFANVCSADERILAAFLAGSRASGAADEHSDLDLCLVAADDARDALWAQREQMVRALGEPLLLEDFDGDQTVHFILADATEGELTFADLGHLTEASLGPYRSIFDRTGILQDLTFTGTRPDVAEQTEELRRLLQWFWHDLSHFIAAIGRGQRWWAAGQLGALRAYAVNLARLRADFGAPLEGYDKVDLALPAADLEPLASTFVPMEPLAMLEAARRIVAWYRAVAPEVATAHDLPYPVELERILVARLDALPVVS
jgi:streptomycin adenylyltransferase